MISPITRGEALQIVSHKLAQTPCIEHLVCHGTKPSNCKIYLDQSEPCWYIYAPWEDCKDVPTIRSSRVILVGKLTGVIHYDGSAGDEG